MRIQNLQRCCLVDYMYDRQFSFEGFQSCGFVFKSLTSPLSKPFKTLPWDCNIESSMINRIPPRVGWPLEDFGTVVKISQMRFLAFLTNSQCSWLRRIPSRQWEEVLPWRDFFIPGRLDDKIQVETVFYDYLTFFCSYGFREPVKPKVFSSNLRAWSSLLRRSFGYHTSLRQVSHSSIKEQGSQGTPFYLLSMAVKSEVFRKMNREICWTHNEVRCRIIESFVDLSRLRTLWSWNRCEWSRTSSRFLNARIERLSVSGT